VAGKLQPEQREIAHILDLSPQQLEQIAEINQLARKLISISAKEDLEQLKKVDKSLIDASGLDELIKRLRAGEEHRKQIVSAFEKVLLVGALNDHQADLLERMILRDHGVDGLFEEKLARHLELSRAQKAQLVQLRAQRDELKVVNQKRRLAIPKGEAGASKMPGEDRSLSRGNGQHAVGCIEPSSIERVRTSHA
jgi:hypothetical protein